MSSKVLWPYPLWIAHRGGGNLAPENTLAAIRTGIDCGYRAVEVDAMLSSDGVPVLMHDPEFGRTVAGTGSVANTPAEQLTQLDAGVWHSAQFAGEKVPRLEAAIKLCRATQTFMNIEIKSSSAALAFATGEQVARVTAQLYTDELALTPNSNARFLSLPPLLSSFSVEALLGAQQGAPHLKRALLVEAVPADWEQKIQHVGASALHVSVKHLTQEHMQIFNAAHLPVMVYTVNTVEKAHELFGWGVSALCTDALTLMRAHFSEKNL